MKYVPEINEELIVVEKRVSKRPVVFENEHPVKSPKKTNRKR